MNFHAIALQLVETSRARGFVATTFEDVPVRLKGLDAEIGELVRAIESGSVREQSLESADVAAMALIILADIGHGQWNFRSSVNRKQPAMCEPDRLVRPLRDYSDRAYEAWRLGHRVDVSVSLELVVVHVVDIRTRCLLLPNDIFFDLQMTMAKNRGRGVTHGGKNPRS